MLKSNNSGRIITNSEGKNIYMKIILICLYIII